MVKIINELLNMNIFQFCSLGFLCFSLSLLPWRSWRLGGSILDFPRTGGKFLDLSEIIPCGSR